MVNFSYAQQRRVWSRSYCSVSDSRLRNIIEDCLDDCEDLEDLCSMVRDGLTENCYDYIDDDEETDSEVIDEDYDDFNDIIDFIKDNYSEHFEREEEEVILMGDL